MNTILLFLGRIGIQEMLVLCIFILIFFGSKKIPEFMRNIGKGVSEFKGVMNDVKKEVDGVKKEIPKIDN